MKFHSQVTMGGLKSIGVPTYNNCEHYYIEPHEGINQTVVIKVGDGKYLTVAIMPDADTVDVKMSGSHTCTQLANMKEHDISLHAYFNLKGGK